MALARVRERARYAARSPLAWIVVATALFYVVGIGWGLPATDGWDNDGVAPRDFLVGLVETFTPGRFFTYPPVHAVLLGVLTAPVTIVVLVKSSSFAQADVIHEALRAPYMTSIAYVARFVSLAMALGTVATIGRIAEEIAGRRAGWCAAAAAAVNATLVYYAHTTNLDVPYLFWGCLALLAIVRAIARHEPRRLRAAAVLAVLAVGTKDQAYALFLLGAPAAMVLWLALDAWPRANLRAVAKEAGVATALGATLFFFVDAVAFNPSGFRARVAFLVGSASQDFADYTNDTTGRIAVVRDCFAHFTNYYPIVFALFAVGGLALHVARTRRAEERGKLVAGLVPLVAAASFTLAFNCVARRTDHRFVLPQHVLLATYIGLAIEPLLFAARGAIARVVAAVAVAAACARALFACATVDANLVLDPRYDAEAWMNAHFADGDTVEIHGNNVYLPRFPARVRVTRVGPDPIETRAPLPGVVEVRDSFDDLAARRPRWIVVSQGWVWRYQVDASAAPAAGHALPPAIVHGVHDADPTGFFRSLLDQGQRYRRVHDSVWSSSVFPPVDIHASTARPIWILERVD